MRDNTIAELAREIEEKLRCSNAVPPDGSGCRSCRYVLIERLPFEYYKLADFWHAYEPYAYSCSYEEICLDAAGLIHEMAEEIAASQKE